MGSFDAPAPPSSGVDWNSHNGALLLFDVQSQEHGVKTTFGDKDPIKADMFVLDGPGAGESYPDTLVFGTVLVSQLKQSIGKKVLGRLGTGNAKPGQKPPWLLNEASDEDQAKGEAWVAEHAKPTVTSAAAPF